MVGCNHNKKHFLSQFLSRSQLGNLWSSLPSIWILSKDFDFLSCPSDRHWCKCNASVHSHVNRYFFLFQTPHFLIALCFLKSLLTSFPFSVPRVTPPLLKTFNTCHGSYLHPLSKGRLTSLQEFEMGNLCRVPQV